MHCLSTFCPTTLPFPLLCLWVCHPLPHTTHYAAGSSAHHTAATFLPGLLDMVRKWRKPPSVSEPATTTTLRVLLPAWASYSFEKTKCLPSDSHHLQTQEYQIGRRKVTTFQKAELYGGAAHLSNLLTTPPQLILDGARADMSREGERRRRQWRCGGGRCLPSLMLCA